MNKQITTLILGIFLLTSVSALYGGETASIDFEFEPVACSVTDNLTFNINQQNVLIDIPTNFIGNFTLTCFTGIEADPVIVYRSGGGSKTKYVDRNITEYKNITQYVDKIIEVPGEDSIIEKIIEVSAKRRNAKIIIVCLILIIIALILWNFKKSENEREFEDYNYRIEKGGQNKNE